MATTWLLLVYKVPPDPTSRRVYVWRKLKRLGAILLHDAVWVLPLTPHTREQFQWLAAEIVEFGGEALIWEATQLLNQHDDALRQQFIEAVASEYQEILEAIDAEDADLAALSRRYQQATSRDYFQTPLGEQIRAALIQARGSEE